MSVEKNMQSSNNQKILITGASGFVGKHLVKRLVAQKKHLVLIGRTDYLPQEFQQNEFIEYIKHDLFSSFTKDILNRLSQIDTVVHLAVITSDRTTPNDDFSIVAQNILLTVNLINIFKKIPPPKTFILGSTIDVYPIFSSHIDETVLPEPISNYAASRLACEFICKTELKKWNNTKLCILRFSQIYGPKDTHSKVISQFVQLALSGKPLTIHGDGSDVRSFLYVEDAVRAIELAIEASTEGIFNVAGIPYSIKKVAEVVGQFSLVPISIQFIPREKPYISSIISIKRAREVLNFYPQFTLVEGIKKMINVERISDVS